MKAKKWLSIITFGCSIFFAIIAILIGKLSESIFYDFSMAVFGSALLGFIMSVIEYNVERRKAMEVFLIESRKALKKLREIKYFNADAPLDKILDCFEEEQHNEFVKSMEGVAGSHSLKAKHIKRDDLISWFKKHIPMSFSSSDNINEEFITYYESLMESYRVDVQKVIDSCIAVADIDLSELDNAYGNLDFFINCKIRGELAYSKIYDKIKEYRNLVLAEKCHFQFLNEGEGNFIVCAKKAMDICGKVFEEKEISTDTFNSKVVYQTVFDDIDNALDDFWCKIYYKKQETVLEHNPIYVFQKNILDDEKDFEG